MPRKRRSATKMRSVAMGHKLTHALQQSIGNLLRQVLTNFRGGIFFTGATASLRGGVGFAAFASAKFGLRAVAEAAARELWPKNIHVAHLIIDAGVDTQWVRDLIKQREGQAALDKLDPNRLMPPAAVAEAYWQLYQQPPSAWVFEQEIRPFGEKW